jgi:LacI family transcriptional regulator
MREFPDLQRVLARLTTGYVSKRLQVQPGHTRPTIRDIALEAGVSVATISRVLNKQAGVSPETREAVLRVIRQRGYSSNPTARGLAGARTGFVSVTLPMIQSSYFGTLTASVVEALGEHDLRAVICPTLHEHDREVSLLNRLMHGTTEGAILILPSETGEELRAVAEDGYPFVVLDPKTPLGDGIPCVSASNARGATDATVHLLGLGHRRIGFITGPRGWIATEERLYGCHASLAEAGVTLEPELEVESDWTVEGGYAAAMHLFGLARPPTAVFALNDNMAMGAMKAARARGLRIPEDVSLVGFDDADEAPLLTPPLTSIRQPLAEMGRMAVGLLTRLLEDLPGEALTVELATRLVVRESTAAVY